MHADPSVTTPAATSPGAEHRRRRRALTKDLLTTTAPVIVLAGLAAYSWYPAGPLFAALCALTIVLWLALRVPVTIARWREATRCPACGGGLNITGTERTCPSCGVSLMPVPPPVRPTATWTPPPHLAHVSPSEIAAREARLRTRRRVAALGGLVTWAAGVYFLLTEESKAAFVVCNLLFVAFFLLGFLSQRCPACGKLILVGRGRASPSHCPRCAHPL